MIVDGKDSRKKFVLFLPIFFYSSWTSLSKWWIRKARNNTKTLGFVILVCDIVFAPLKACNHSENRRLQSLFSSSIHKRSGACSVDLIEMSRKRTRGRPRQCFIFRPRQEQHLRIDSFEKLLLKSSHISKSLLGRHPRFEALLLETHRIRLKILDLQ